MKNIEYAIKGAITDRATKQLSIRDKVENCGNTTKYRLWDSNIYSVHHDLNEVVFSFCGYQTTTTKSRINALLPGGCSVYQKNWDLFLNVDGVVYSFGSCDRVHINLNNRKVDIIKAV